MWRSRMWVLGQTILGLVPVSRHHVVLDDRGRAPRQNIFQCTSSHSSLPVRDQGLEVGPDEAFCEHRPFRRLGIALFRYDRHHA